MVSARLLNTVLALVAFVKASSASPSTCYFGDGTVASGHSPCSSVGESTFSACCASGQHCIAGGVCQRQDNGLFTLGSCTDASLQDEACALMKEPVCSTSSARYLRALGPNTSPDPPYVWPCASDPSRWTCDGEDGSGVDAACGNGDAFNVAMDASPAGQLALPPRSAVLPPQLEMTLLDTNLTSNGTSNGTGPGNSTGPGEGTGSSGGLSDTDKWVIAGICGGAAVMAILGVWIWCCCRRRRKKRNENQEVSVLTTVSSPRLK